MDESVSLDTDDQLAIKGISGGLELLSEMGQDFAASLDLDATLLRGIERITTYVGAEAGALFLLQENGTILRCTASAGATEITGLTLASDEGIVGRCVQTDTGTIVRDVAKDPNFQNAIDAQTGFTTRSILCAPLSVKNEKIGAIELVNKADGDGLFGDDDLNLLQTLSASAALAVLNARMAEALVEQERLKRELELAAEIQRGLLPEASDASFPVHGVNLPARTVSGDFYDYFPLDDGRICFNLGDVSGKGMNAALLMAKTASLFRCLGKTIHQPGRLLALINEEICETVTRGMFVTMIGGIYDPRHGSVRLANAGHEPPLLHGTDGSFVGFPADVPPLGVMPLMSPDESFPEVEIALAGGSLYIFTDGVTEGYLEDGSEMQTEGLKKILADNREQAAPARLQAVISRIDQKGTALRDDLTLLVIDDGTTYAERLADPATADDQPPAADEETSEMVLHLKFTSRPDRLKLVRNAVFDTAMLCGCSEATARDIVIAIDEASQNVIRHAYKGASDGQVILDISREKDDIVLHLRDFAEKVDVSKIKPRDLDDIRPGGLGTHFIAEVMDEVVFIPPPDGTGNLLRMKKRIS
ncbi:MAG TPA: GAF domain-containing protein [Rhodospirillales bacterium]|nr:GAF domain-containing protein [Rhodospirillales bacterium]